MSFAGDAGMMQKDDGEPSDRSLRVRRHERRGKVGFKRNRARLEGSGKNPKQYRRCATLPHSKARLRIALVVWEGVWDKRASL